MNNWVRLLVLWALTAGVSAPAQAHFLGLTPIQQFFLKVSPCVDLTDPYKIQISDHEELDLQHNSFSYVDYEGDFEFSAQLDQWGIFEFNAQLKNVELRTRSAYSGKKLFRRAIKHFGKRNIAGIRGSWVFGDNLISFHTNVKEKRMSPEDAARNTWTGKMAAKYGFTEVQFEKSSVVSEEGLPSIRVVFYRPGSPRL